MKKTFSSVVITFLFLTSMGCSAMFTNSSHKNNMLNVQLQGDIQISQPEFYQKINKTCIFDTENEDKTPETEEIEWAHCVLSKIAFNYDELPINHEQNAVTQMGKFGEFDVFLKNVQTEDFPFHAYTMSVLHLITQKNGKQIDFIPIYAGIYSKEEFFSGSLYYFIDQNFEVSTLQTIVRLDKADYVFAKKYKINEKTGKFEFINGIRKSCYYSSDSQCNENEVEKITEKEEKTARDHWKAI